MDHQKENGKPTTDPKVNHFYNQELTHTCECEQGKMPMSTCVACWCEQPTSGELKKSKRVWYGLCKQGGDSHNHNGTSGSLSPNGSLNGYADTENRNQKAKPTKCFSISDLCPSPESPDRQKPRKSPENGVSKSPENGVLSSLSSSLNQQNSNKQTPLRWAM